MRSQGESRERTSRETGKCPVALPAHSIVAPANSGTLLIVEKFQWLT